MEYVDYQKLAEQYASFLIAVGGISITVLALVLNLNPKSGESHESTEGYTRSFLVAALVVAALSCFVGVQMLAETAAFTNFTKPIEPTNVTKPVESTNATETAALPNLPESIKFTHPTTKFTHPTKRADRLFLLASSNIFVAIILAFFALMVLPLASGKVHHKSMKPISMLFFLVLFGALYWAVLAGLYRMPVPGRESAILQALVISLIWGFFFYYLTEPKKWSFITKLVKCLLFTRPMKWSLRRKLRKRLLRTRLRKLLLRIRLRKRLRRIRLRKWVLHTRASKEWLRWEVLPKRWQLWLTFAPSALLTSGSLIWFTWIFSTGNQATLLEATIHEGRFFSLSIGLSYASLMVAGIINICKGKFANEQVITENATS
jgi:hypothetical protein